MHSPVEHEDGIIGHVYEVAAVNQPAFQLQDSAFDGVFEVPVFRRLVMPAEKPLAHNGAVPLPFNPVHQVRVLVGVQLLGNLDVFDEVPADEGIVSAAAEGKALFCNHLLQVHKPFISQVVDNVDVYAPDSAHVGLDAFLGFPIPVVAEDHIAVGEHEPFRGDGLDAFFSGSGAGTIHMHHRNVVVALVEGFHDFEGAIDAEAVNDYEAVYGYVLVNAV